MNRVQHLHTILDALFYDFLRWGTLESRSSHRTTDWLLERTEKARGNIMESRIRHGKRWLLRTENKRYQLAS